MSISPYQGAAAPASIHAAPQPDSPQPTSNAGGAATATGQGLDSLMDTARGYLEQGREAAGELEEKLQSHIREEPVRALLIAAGIGLGIGLLMSRR